MPPPPPPPPPPPEPPPPPDPPELDELAEPEYELDALLLNDEMPEANDAAWNAPRLPPSYQSGGFWS